MSQINNNDNSNRASATGSTESSVEANNGFDATVIGVNARGGVTGASSPEGKGNYLQASTREIKLAMRENADGIRDSSAIMKEAMGENVDKLVVVTDKVVGTIDNGVEKVTNSIDNGVEKVTNSVDNGVEKVTKSIDNGVEKVTNSVDNGVEKVTKSIDNGADKFEVASDKWLSFLYCILFSVNLWWVVSFLWDGENVNGTGDKVKAFLKLTAIAIPIVVVSHLLIALITHCIFGRLQSAKRQRHAKEKQEEEDRKAARKREEEDRKAARKQKEENHKAARKRKEENRKAARKREEEDRKAARKREEEDHKAARKREEKAAEQERKIEWQNHMAELKKDELLLKEKLRMKARQEKKKKKKGRCLRKMACWCMCKKSNNS